MSSRSNSVCDNRTPEERIESAKSLLFTKAGISQFEDMVKANGAHGYSIDEQGIAAILGVCESHAAGFSVESELKIAALLLANAIQTKRNLFIRRESAIYRLTRRAPLSCAETKESIETPNRLIADRMLQQADSESKYKSLESHYANSTRQRF